MVFIIAAAANIAAAVLAVAVLKPWRSRVIRRSSEQVVTSWDGRPPRVSHGVATSTITSPGVPHSDRNALEVATCKTMGVG
jgi:hypothetical protein